MKDLIRIVPVSYPCSYLIPVSGKGSGKGPTILPLGSATVDPDRHNDRQFCSKCDLFSTIKIDSGNSMTCLSVVISVKYCVLSKYYLHDWNLI